MVIMTMMIDDGSVGDDDGDDLCDSDDGDNGYRW